MRNIRNKAVSCFLNKTILFGLLCHLIFAAKGFSAHCFELDNRSLVQVPSLDLTPRILPMAHGPLLPSKALFIDLETGGLIANEHPIAEVVLGIIDERARILDVYHAVPKLTPEQIQLFNPFALKAHQSNGLIAEALASPKEWRAVKHEMVQFILKHFSGEMNQGKKISVIGNSQHFDIRFLEHWHPDFHKHLSHSFLDVSSFRNILKMFRGVTVEKPRPHRAVDDMMLSISELKTFLSLFETSEPM